MVGEGILVSLVVFFKEAFGDGEVRGEGIYACVLEVAQCL